MGVSILEGGLMGKFKRLIYSLMTIVLTLLGAIFITLAIIKQDMLFAILYYLQNSNIRRVYMLLGLVLLAFAISLIIDLIISSRTDYEYLIENEAGNILIKRYSLESLARIAIEKFGLKALGEDVKILTKEGKIKLASKIEVCDEVDLPSLSEKIKAEIRKALGELTGLKEIEIDLYFQKAKDRREKD